MVPLIKNFARSHKPANNCRSLSDAVHRRKKMAIKFRHEEENKKKGLSFFDWVRGSEENRDHVKWVGSWSWIGRWRLRKLEENVISGDSIELKKKMEEDWEECCQWGWHWVVRRNGGIRRECYQWEEYWVRRWKLKTPGGNAINRNSIQLESESWGNLRMLTMGIALSWKMKMEVVWGECYLWE